MEIRPELDSRFEYFDASGTMVGVDYCTDCDCFCNNTSFCKDYGFVPDCERERVDAPCEPGAP